MLFKHKLGTVFFHLALPLPTFCKMGVKPWGQPTNHNIKAEIKVALFFFFSSCPFLCLYNLFNSTMRSCFLQHRIPGSRFYMKHSKYHRTSSERLYWQLDCSCNIIQNFPAFFPCQLYIRAFKVIWGKDIVVWLQRAWETVAKSVSSLQK